MTEYLFRDDGGLVFAVTMKAVPGQSEDKLVDFHLKRIRESLKVLAEETGVMYGFGYDRDGSLADYAMFFEDETGRIIDTIREDDY